jgi:hypothetical protein
MKIIYDGGLKVGSEEKKRKEIEVGDVKCFLINLASRPDRLRHSLAELSNVGIIPEIISVTKPTDKGPFSCTGKRGNYESHLRCLEMISKSNNECGIFAIIQDDILLTTDFRGQFQRAVNLMLPNADIDILYLYNEGYPAYTSDLKLIKATSTIIGDQFCLFTKKSACKILKLMKGIEDKGIPFDIAINGISEINRYSVNTILAYQSQVLGTDIPSSGGYGLRI